MPGSRFASLFLDPGLPAFEPFPIFYYGSLPFAVLALIASLDRSAGRALATLRPLLRLSDAEVADTRRELTVAPARPALVITIFAVVITPVGYILDPVASGWPATRHWGLPSAGGGRRWWRRSS